MQVLSRSESGPRGGQGNTLVPSDELHEETQSRKRRLIPRKRNRGFLRSVRYRRQGLRHETPLRLKKRGQAKKRRACGRRPVHTRGGENNPSQPSLNERSKKTDPPRVQRKLPLRGSRKKKRKKGNPHQISLQDLAELITADRGENIGIRT